MSRAQYIFFFTLSLFVAVGPRAFAILPAQGQHALLLDDPELSFSARLDLIHESQNGDSIDLVYFIVEDDLYGVIFIDALMNAAARGVHIRFLVDDLNNRVDPSFWVMTDLYPNIQVKYFRPFPSLNLRTVGRRVHDKIMILNQRQVLFGGRNISREYFAPDTHWMDTDILVAGPVAEEASNYFSNLWNHSESKDPDFKRHAYKSNRLKKIFAYCHIQESPATCIKQSKNKIREEYLTVCKVRKRPKKLLDCHGKFRVFFRGHFHWWAQREAIINIKRDFQDLREQRQAIYKHEMVPYQYAQWLNNFNNIYDWSSGVPEGSLSDVLYDSIATAQDRIWMSAPYLISTRAMRKAFLQAHTNNSEIDIKVATNSFTSTEDPFMVTIASMSRQKKLDNAGVQVYRQNGERYLHAKVTLIDDDQIFISSFNMDPRSEKLNSESGAIIISEELAAQVALSLQNKLSQSWHDDNGNNRKRIMSKIFGFWDRVYHDFIEKVILKIPGTGDQL